jgi:hypothetical protein
VLPEVSSLEARVVDILIRNISITAPHKALITMKKEDANKDLYRITITRSSGKN